MDIAESVSLCCEKNTHTRAWMDSTTLWDHVLPESPMLYLTHCLPHHSVIMVVVFSTVFCRVKIGSKESKWFVQSCMQVQARWFACSHFLMLEAVCTCSYQSMETHVNPTLHIQSPGMHSAPLCAASGSSCLTCLSEHSLWISLKTCAIAFPWSFVNSYESGHNRQTLTFSLTVVSSPVTLSFPQCVH